MPQTEPTPPIASPIFYAIGYNFQHFFHFAYCTQDEDDILDFCYDQMRVIPCTRAQALAFVDEAAVQYAETVCRKTRSELALLKRKRKRTACRYADILREYLDYEKSPDRAPTRSRPCAQKGAPPEPPA